MPEISKDAQTALQKTTSFIWEVTKVVVISLAIILPIRYFLIQPFYVKGASMEPNFHNYEYLIIDQLSYRFHPPTRGDVVVMRNPQRPSQFFIKRVIGLPGEHVQIKDQRVYINGEPLNESPYLDDDVETYGSIDITLEPDRYIVLGDNRTESLDGRVFGPISQEEMVGRTWIRAWPFTRINHFKTVQYN
ncbi:MAG: signal peptidase I [Candidatus Kerfeldbacteria bacterium CG15_BIG_FIL_POST_REV_8_21_14_020_45_12]|uniref:Signal peptidase I n=1 Tax=Candidatus Kerfeldbacteria bacterium CG15_BIG_FIL_POST_REV_8_21_14_020_45_12 TaxID=2014247 RepID=A0A2M7H216_9BACT|nr:MAG: signal peptidase I [Candidatus Kerfeldbacteria bacterium CG15_BIG_FIL_POST_REV_8_21_14_020_45_12]PJA93437.1 MAG: signal peptidase I [Candidatus Kerfeldbacteria bacterium CG_4_9_14_3_um_filter_45_8]